MLKTKTCRGSPHERGAITPILAVTLVMALGLMALTVDLGQLFVAKNELQNIADAAALAGAKKLIQAKDPNNPGLAAVYCSEAITTAQAIAAENRSSGDTMTVTGADVTVGQWNLATGSFSRTGCSANPMEVTAIQVRVRRDGTDNPTLGAFFAGKAGGSSQMNSTATAVAYLGLAGTSSLSIPFGVPTNYPAGQAPYVRSVPVLDWFTPRPAMAADPQPYTWKDLGGTTLDTTRATFIMPTVRRAH
jgi:Flp pilus assembly protein TadG